MSQKLTRKGARNFTELVDRVADIVQKQAAVLGFPERIALDFVKRCDLISDAAELTAAANFPLQASDDAEEEEEEEESDTEASKKGSSGMSVEPDGEGFDANAIGDEQGPHKQEGDESYMSGHFSQSENHQLADKQQSGSLPSVDGKLASTLSELAKVLAKLAAAETDAEACGDDDMMAEEEDKTSAKKKAEDEAEAEAESEAEEGKASSKKKAEDEAAEDEEDKGTGKEAALGGINLFE